MNTDSSVGWVNMGREYVTVEIGGVEKKGLVVDTVYCRKRVVRVKGREYVEEECTLRAYIPKSLRAKRYLIIPYD